MTLLGDKDRRWLLWTWNLSPRPKSSPKMGSRDADDAAIREKKKLLKNFKIQKLRMLGRFVCLCVVRDGFVKPLFSHNFLFAQ